MTDIYVEVYGEKYPVNMGVQYIPGKFPEIEAILTVTLEGVEVTARDTKEMKQRMAFHLSKNTSGVLVWDGEENVQEAFLKDGALYTINGASIVSEKKYLIPILYKDIFLEMLEAALKHREEEYRKIDEQMRMRLIAAFPGSSAA